VEVAPPQTFDPKNYRKVKAVLIGYKVKMKETLRGSK
jgi:hypothetical protein